MSPIPIYTQYTPAHRVLFEEHFEPTLPEGEDVRAEFSDLPGDGEFYSAEWHRCVTKKFEILLRGVEKCRGGALVWCDADVQFFPGFSTASMAHDLKAVGKDLLFQQEGIEPRPGHKEVNTGVFIARVSEQLAVFFRHVLSQMEDAERPNDQNLINEFLPQQSLVSWGYLSPRYYARTHGFPPPRDVVLHHANTTIRNSVIGKRRQMLLVRKAVTGTVTDRMLACMTVFCAKGVPALVRALKRQLRGRGPEEKLVHPGC